LLGDGAAALAGVMSRRRPIRKSNDAPGFRRGPRVADRMTPAYFAFLGTSFAAERAKLYMDVH
jgi:hypothetical protein